MLTLTKEEMLNQWRLRSGLRPLRHDIEILRHDAVDTDALLQLKIDDWYHGLLRDADITLLPVENLAAAAVTECSAEGVVTVTLPDRAVRAVAVKLEEWENHARVTAPRTGRMAELQNSVYVRGGSVNPVAVCLGRTLTLYSSDEIDPVLESLLCVAAPADGTYRLDRSLLDTIPTINTPY